MKKGDSGGPLVMKDESEKFNLVGVISFGDAKCSGFEIIDSIVD